MELKESTKYKKTEIGMIPSDWEVKSIGEIFSFYSTSNYSKAEMSLYGQVGCVHYGLIHAIENAHYSLSKGIKYYVTKEQAKYELIQEGDVIMVDASEDLVGLNKSIEVFDLNNKEYIAGLHTFHLRDNNSTYAGRFRGLVLNSNSVKTQMLKLAVGMKVFGVSKPQLQQVFVPIPPKVEQALIAGALSDADAMISSLEKLIAKKKLIKQGMMQKLLTPKEGWVKKKLGEVAEIYRGGSPRPIESYITSSSDGVNWIKIGDVGKNAKYIESTQEKIIQEGVSRSRYVNEGDFLLSNSMSFGRPYILKTNGCIHDGWLAIQNYQSSFNTDYLYYVLGSESVITQYKAMAAGSGVLNLNKEVVKNVTIACPPLQEQFEIAEILSLMDETILKLENKLAKANHIKQGMMQVLLTGKVRLI